MNAREKLDKIKADWELRTDEELAKKLEISKETINSWVKRNKIPEKWDLKMVHMNHPVPTQTLTIPKLSAKVSAGYNIQTIDSIEKIGDLVIDITAFKTKPPKDIFAMQVDGYSMIPMLYPDSWVIFDSVKTFRGDGLYVINWDDCLMVKLLQATSKQRTIKIISSNKDYESWEINLEDTQQAFLIFGKVIRAII